MTLHQIQFYFGLKSTSQNKLVQFDKNIQTRYVACFCRKRMLAVLQEMLALPQTSSSLVSLLTEKLLALIPDDQRRIQTVSYILHFL